MREAHHKSWRLLATRWHSLMEPTLLSAENLSKEAIYQLADLAQLLRSPDSLAGQRFAFKGLVAQGGKDDGEPTLILEAECLQ